MVAVMTLRRRRCAGLALLIALTGCQGMPAIDATAPSPSPQVPSPAASSANSPPVWQDRVFYEIFVRSFADSTTGPLAGDGIGDFQGLIERLDYLNDGDPATTDDLGITGIWLMPISPSPSYHGYDVTDYYAVNPQYGSMEDLRRFLAEAHRRGIVVITDLVLNHSSVKHPAFRAALRDDPQYRDWYIFVPESEVPTTRGPWDQVVWHELGRKHYYGIFWSGMPDLNYRTPAVTAEAHRIAQFWLRDVGVDGFRLDAIRHLIENGDEMSDTPETVAWLQDFQRHVRRVAPEAFTVGEVWTVTETVSDYVAKDALDLAFEFELATAILEAARTGQGDKLTYAIANVARSYPAGRYATFVTNHDQNRIASELREDSARMKLAASLLLTLPGVPFIYYGEEIGQIGAKPDEMIRNPMPWTSGTHGGFTTAAQPWEPLQRGHERRNVATQEADPDSLLHHYKRLIRLRQSEPALRRGAVRVLETGRADVVAWERVLGERRLVVVANLSAAPIEGFELAGEAGGWQRDLLGSAVQGGRFSLAPHALAVLERATSP
jgi:glycosidase